MLKLKTYALCVPITKPIKKDWWKPDEIDTSINENNIDYIIDRLKLTKISFGCNYYVQTCKNEYDFIKNNVINFEEHIDKNNQKYLVNTNKITYIQEDEGQRYIHFNSSNLLAYNIK